MGRLGRVLAAAALVLTIVLPGAAAAQEPAERPLADIPEELVPGMRAVAEQFGLSYEQLRNASEAQLEAVLCAEADDASPQQIATRASAALDDSGSDLSDAERQRLQKRLPGIIADLETEYCATGAATDDRDEGSTGATGDDHNGRTGEGDGATNDASEPAGGDDDGSSDDEAAQTGNGSAATNSDGIPLPTRVDTGAGGATGGDNAAPIAFGALFASLFGMVGVGLTRRQTG